MTYSRYPSIPWYTEAAAHNSPKCITEVHFLAVEEALEVVCNNVELSDGQQAGRAGKSGFSTASVCTYSQKGISPTWRRAVALMGPSWASPTLRRDHGRWQMWADSCVTKGRSSSPICLDL